MAGFRCVFLNDGTCDKPIAFIISLTDNSPLLSIWSKVSRSVGFFLLGSYFHVSVFQFCLFIEKDAVEKISRNE